MFQSSNMKEVLVEVDSSKNVIQFESNAARPDSEIVKTILRSLANKNQYLKQKLRPNVQMLIQVYRNEFDSYVDVSDNDVICNKARLKVILVGGSESQNGQGFGESNSTASDNRIFGQGYDKPRRLGGPNDIPQGVLEVKRRLEDREIGGTLPGRFEDRGMGERFSSDDRRFEERSGFGGPDHMFDGRPSGYDNFEDRGPMFDRPGPMFDRDAGPMSGGDTGPMLGRDAGPMFDRNLGPMFDRGPGPMFGGGDAGPMFDREPGPMYGREPGPMYGRDAGPMFGRDAGPMFGREPGPMFGRDAGPMFDDPRMFRGPFMDVRSPMGGFGRGGFNRPAPRRHDNDGKRDKGGYTWDQIMIWEEDELAFKFNEPPRVSIMYEAALECADRQPVSMLNEYCQSEGWPKPEFEVIRDGTNTANPLFKYKVKVNDRWIVSDRHSMNKKQARVYAAIKALYINRALY